MNAQLLAAVKGAMGITSTAEIITNEINDLIDAAICDLKSNGVNAETMTDDPLILQAIKTYCRANFHSPADHDQLQKSYKQQKGHLMNATGYTTWPGGDADAAG